MIHSIYNQVGNTSLKPASKERPYSPISLLKSNFLGEFETDLEKKLAREHIGVNITGKYNYDSKGEHISDISQITSIHEALDYALTLVKSYQDKEVENQIETIKSNLDQLTEALNTQDQNLTTLQELVNTINEQVGVLNSQLTNLNVDNKIEAWIRNHSGSVALNEESKLDFAISQAEGNAIKSNEDGLYVESSAAAVYKSSLADDVKMNTAIGGFKEGTKVSDLKDKAFSTILDKLLFPVSVRDLVQPYIVSNVVNQLVEINSSVIPANSTFIKGDAGELIDKQDTITFNNAPFTETTYNQLGDYIYKVNASYAAGEYLIDDRGQTTDKRVEAGTINKTLATITATYPWYYNDTKGTLVKYNSQSELMEINLTGNAIIKIPGSNSTLDVLKVDGGLGFLDVDLSGWTKTTEQINNYTYQVWTKNDAYTSELPHKIQFTLA